MKRFLFSTFLGCLLSIGGLAQNNAIPNVKVPGLMQRISKEISGFKADTSAVPNDKITKKIEELRKYRGKFNVDALVDIKLAQAKKSHLLSKEQYDQANNFFKKGNGKRWLDNAIIWVYRKHFSYKELKAMVRFYRSTAGQKWASEFPIVAIQNSLAAEQIGKIYKNMNKKE